MKKIGAFAILLNVCFFFFIAASALDVVSSCCVSAVHCVVVAGLGTAVNCRVVGKPEYK